MFLGISCRSNEHLGSELELDCNVVEFQCTRVDFKTSVVDSVKFLALIRIVSYGIYALHTMKSN